MHSFCVAKAEQGVVLNKERWEKSGSPETVSSFEINNFQVHQAGFPHFIQDGRLLFLLNHGQILE